jgi:hypothetical protein
MISRSKRLALGLIELDIHSYSVILDQDMFRALQPSIVHFRYYYRYRIV